MKKRTIWKMLVLTIITLDIYRIYWLIKTRKEIITERPDVKILSPLVLFIPIAIFFVTFAVFIGTLVASSNATCQNSTTGLSQNINIYSAASSNTQYSNCSLSKTDTLGLIQLYVGIFIAYLILVIWEWSYAKGVEAITNEKLGFAVTLLILILVPDGIDILIIQDYYNKISSNMPPPQPNNINPVRPV